MKTILKLLGLLILAVALLMIFGPRQKLDAIDGYDFGKFDDIALGNIDDYLAREEARFDDIKTGQQKEVIWAGAPETKTDIAIVYIHGFSASKQEIRPVPDLVAKAIGANLYYTRLAGHGRPMEAMADVDVNEWLADFDEAMRIGREIGDKVYVISTSTGATLTAYAMMNSYAGDFAGAVLISPNFGVPDPMAPLATWPFFEHWGPLIAGEFREWEPLNAAQEQYWTTKYPIESVVPMMTLVGAVKDAADQRPEIPSLFYYSDLDQVVAPELTAKVAQAWGADVIQPDLTDEDEPSAHVIAGDIASPAQNDIATQRILDWIKSH